MVSFFLQIFCGDFDVVTVLLKRFSLGAGLCTVLPSRPPAAGPSSLSKGTCCGRTRTPTGARMHIHVCTHTYAHPQVHTPPRAPTYTHTSKHTHPHAHAQMHTCRHTCMEAWGLVQGAVPPSAPPEGTGPGSGSAQGGAGGRPEKQHPEPGPSRKASGRRERLLSSPGDTTMASRPGRTALAPEEGTSRQ